ncbi:MULTISPECIES: hypothetical protein [unclassified Ruegeria]|uniref:hypothetical protein n=1 Tax=unclassified Ruegeria TaxID=2625375 RepID=UPI001AD9D2BC|nr:MULTISPECIES: hypothetical protein [unclassified Ruegeria]MBO9410879.1 hypothetical protein [Ruegeria sp. R8_1]MBO9415080.1 hypothetical protein [Ruegeria sp. R8_2]
MKVTRNTPNQLILSNTPWFIGISLIFFILAFVGAGLFMATDGGEGILFGLFFAVFGGGMGIGAFCVFVRRVQVILDRPSNSVLIRRQSVFGYDTVEHELRNLSHAEVETTTSTRDRTTSKMHRPVLILEKGMSAGRHPIVEAYVSGHGAQRLVDAVNNWLPARAVDSDSQSA